MSKVLTFSTKFPACHPRKGDPTNFVFKIWNSLGNTNPALMPYAEKVFDHLSWDRSNHEFLADMEPKGHTIRAGNRWKVGEWFSPRIWTGAPYNSKQLTIAPDIQIKKLWSFEMQPSNFVDECKFILNQKVITSQEMFSEVAKNDGLTTTDFAYWFAGSELMSNKRKPFSGQVICWDSKIQYIL